MKDETLEEYVLAKCNVEIDVDDMDRAVAEISFKAGRELVVDWLKQEIMRHAGTTLGDCLAATLVHYFNYKDIEDSPQVEQ